jgi:hypothetical protein
MGSLKHVPEHFETEKGYFIGFCDVQLDFLLKIMVTVPEAFSGFERETP